MQQQLDKLNVSDISALAINTHSAGISKGCQKITDAEFLDNKIIGHSQLACNAITLTVVHHRVGQSVMTDLQLSILAQL